MKTWSRRAALTAIGAAALAARAEDSRTYAPGPFDRLDVSGVARIELSQGERDQVVVVGDESAQRSLEITVSNGQLRIRGGDGWKFWDRERVQVQVQMREIKRIDLSGASDIRAARPIRAEQLAVSVSGQGSVRLDDLKAAQLRFDISGAGDGRLAGRVDELRLSISGQGKLFGEQLRAARARIDISGVGNADVWVTDELAVGVSGIGQVNYWGQPTVRRSTSGMASVNAKGDR